MGLQPASFLGLSNMGSKNWAAHLFTQQISPGQKLGTGPGARHTAMKTADMVLVFMGQTGLAGDQHDRTCFMGPTPGFQ